MQLLQIFSTNQSKRRGGELFMLVSAIVPIRQVAKQRVGTGLQPAKNTE